MTLDPDPLHVPETDDDAPAVRGCHWIAVGLIGFALIVGVLLLAVLLLPVAGSVTESRYVVAASSPAHDTSHVQSGTPHVAP